MEPSVSLLQGDTLPDGFPPMRFYFNSSTSFVHLANKASYLPTADPQLFFFYIKLRKEPTMLCI